MSRLIPGIAYAAAPRAQQYAAALAWPPRLLVIHDTGNPASTRYDEAHYAATRTDPRDRWTSAHAYVDPGGVLGSLPLSLQAWAAYGYANGHGLHLEMCKAGDVVQPATIQRTAALTRQLCQLAGIPMVKLTPTQVAAGQRGVCGHHDITVGLGVGNHHDPEPFDWAAFMRLVTTAGEEDDMVNTWTQPLTQGTPGYAGQQRDTALAFAWQASNEAAAGVGKLLAAAAASEARDRADEVRDQATLAAIQALAVGGNADAVPQITAAITAVRDEAHERFGELLQRLAAMEARAVAAETERDQLHARLSRAYHADAVSEGDAAPSSS